MLVAIALVLCSMELSASEPSEPRSRYRRFDDAICRFLMDGMDSTYVRVPSTSWEIPVVTKMYGYGMHITPGSDALALDSGVCAEVGLGIGYHGLDLVITQPVGHGIPFNFEFDYYDNYWGLGINVSDRSFGGELFGEAPGGGSELQTSSVLLDGYIALNGSKYSYPAAIYGNYVQVRSAGSPLINIWYEHSSCTPFSTRAAALLGECSLDEAAVTAGYGYNLSISEGKVLLNASAGVGTLLPAFGLAANARAGAVLWINDNLRLGCSLTGFYHRSWSGRDMYLEALNCRGFVNVTYCFGNNGK